MEPHPLKTRSAFGTADLNAERLGWQIFAELKDHLKQFSRRSNFQLLKPQIKFKSSFVARCYHRHIFLRFLPCLQPQGIRLIK